MAIKKVVMGSESDSERRAVAAALKALGIDVAPIDYKIEADVSVQPQGMLQITFGAGRRMEKVRGMHPDADLCIGIESGVVHESWGWDAVTCAVIWEHGNPFKKLAHSAHFPIPSWMVLRALSQGTDIGAVAKDLASGGEKDPMAWLSQGTVLRETLLTQALLCALVEIVYPENYREPVVGE